MSKKLFGIVLILVLASMLVACAPAEEPAEEPMEEEPMEEEALKVVDIMHGDREASGNEASA